MARAELAKAGIAVSTMYPFVTATEFGESIRAGREAASELESSHAPQPQTPEQVAEAILDLINTGAEQADLVPGQFGGSYKGLNGTTHGRRMTMPSTNRALLETPLENLYATPPAPLPFLPSTDVRAFLLKRARGNLIVYNAPGLASVASEIQALGGATRQLVNHAHEAMFGPQGLEVGVFVHERDREETAESLPVEGTFAERHTLDDDFELIPTPGHTPGTTSFLWHSGHHRFLFTGDTVAIENGDWRAAVLGSSDRAAYLDSLALLRELEFDVLVPWAASAPGPYIDMVSRAQAQRRIDAIIARIEAGGSELNRALAPRH